MPTIALSSPASGAVAAAGSTALVLEHICLFSRDLRRKQKRWQDGRLKYHTFNKRVMVYDDRGNFIGDSHWQGDGDLEDGEELQLERGGVVVQVAECVGQRAQDLTELLDKRAQEKEHRHAAAAASRTSTPGMPRRPQPPLQPQSDHFQLRHRPLAALIGNPTGHYGRAVVAPGSPFEQRQRVATAATPDRQDEERPGKRRKHDTTPPSKMGYARSLFGTTLNLSGAPASSRPSQWPPVNRQRQLPQAPSSSPDDSLPGLDKPTTRGIPVAVTSQNFSSSVEIIGSAHRSPEPEFTPSREPRPQNPVCPDPQVRPSKPTATSRPVASPTVNNLPLKEISNRPIPDSRVTTTKARSAKPSVNGPQLIRQASSEGEVPSLSRRVQKKTRKSPPAPPESAPTELAPLESLPTEPAPVDIIEIDCEETPAEIVPERRKPTMEDKPRTELRLKSRRKRGLLLVAEQETRKSSEDEAAQTLTSKRDHVAPRRRQPSPAPSRSISDVENEDSDTFVREETRKTKRRKTARERNTRKRGDESSNEEAPLRRRVERISPDTTGQEWSAESPEAFDEDSDDVAPPPRKTKRTRALPRDDDAVETAPPVLPKPRLIRLARKSVKSKELVGFVTKDDGAYSNRPKTAALMPAQRGFQKPPEEPSKGPTKEPPEEPPEKPRARADKNPRGASAEAVQIRLDADKSRDDEPTRAGVSNAKPTSEPPLVIPDRPEPAVEKPPQEAKDDKLSQSHQAAAKPPQTNSDESRPPPDHQSPPAQTPTSEPSQPPSVIPNRSDNAGPSNAAGIPAKDGPQLPGRLEPQPNQVSALAALKPGPTGGPTTQPAIATTPEVQNQQPKLINPATRGRKAALKIHAAGQVPQSFLPPDSVTPLGTRPGGGGNGSAAPKVGGNEPPKIKMKFPGFVSANSGGPWSREAHDLFETGRPG